MSENVYSKLAKARLLLQEKDIKKSGHNKHLNFKYSELDDFIPAINGINGSLKMVSLFSISQDPLYH